MAGAPRTATCRPAALLLVALAALACAAAALALGAPRARAGAWTLATCTQPNGEPAPADGWKPGYWAGVATAGSGAANPCAQGGSLTALSSGASAAVTDGGPEWIFTAPGGSTIAGGVIAATFTAPLGQAWIGTPLPAYDGADVIAGCGAPGGCPGGTASGAYAIDHPGGTRLYAPALCVDAGQPTCPVNGAAVNAEVSIKAADIELSDIAQPRVTAVGGGLLAPRAHGNAVLRLTASDIAAGGGFGPGIYSVTVVIDGVAVYSGVPDANRGLCVPLGTDPTTGGLIFDHSQPCARTASVVIPVATRNLGDGRHALLVSVSDAAGDVATVLKRTITTFNPLLSPSPDDGAVATQLQTGWSYSGGQTTLETVTARGLPRSGHVSARCVGRGCPVLSPARVRVTAAGRLWRSLRTVRFSARERLELTVSAPHRRAERIDYSFRRASQPVQTLRSAR
jgi:hypothetical protein